jgi:2-oxo-4-hydroxy-4-carboxy-5-ureidoimidazoline decarboxylase
MTIASFDQLPVEEKNEILGMCCNSSAWIKRMLAIFPVQNLVDLLEYAEEEWYDCNPADWLEAFQNHIKIGEIETIENNKSRNADWVRDEQSFIKNSTSERLKELQKANDLYEETYGYNFIVAAAGKSIDEILENLLSRLQNNPQDELIIAAGEQNKITQQRLQRLFV